jgi:hypothetical protein
MIHFQNHVNWFIRQLIFNRCFNIFSSLLLSKQETLFLSQYLPRINFNSLFHLSCGSDQQLLLNHLKCFPRQFRIRIKIARRFVFMIRCSMWIFWLVLLLASLGDVVDVTAQNSSPKNSFRQISGVTGAKERPDLAEPYNNNLRFRISLRPRTFRRGDILTVLGLIRNNG